METISSKYQIFCVWCYYISPHFHNIILPCKLLHPFRSENRSNMETYSTNCGEVPHVAYQQTIANDEEEKPQLNIMSQERKLLSEFMVKVRYMWGRVQYKQQSITTEDRYFVRALKFFLLLLWGFGDLFITWVL